MSLGVSNGGEQGDRLPRAKKYAQWLRGTVPEGEWKLIREATQRGQLIVSRKFENEISEKLGRRIELCGPGRPKKRTK